jgi:hypothetical protein
MQNYLHLRILLSVFILFRMGLCLLLEPVEYQDIKTALDLIREN